MAAGQGSGGGSANNAADATEVIKAKLSLKSAALVAVIAAAASGLGSYISGNFLVKSTQIPAIIAARTTCINQVKIEEKEFRDRAAKFQAAVSDFDTDSSLLYKPNSNQLYPPAKVAISQGLSISSYGSKELSVAAIKIATSIKRIALMQPYSANTQAERTSLADSLAQWKESYDRFILTFDAKREECGPAITYKSAS